MRTDPEMKSRGPDDAHTDGWTDGTKRALLCGGCAYVCVYLCACVCVSCVYVCVCVCVCFCVFMCAEKNSVQGVSVGV